MLWDKWIREVVWSEGEWRRVLSHSVEVWFGGVEKVEEPNGWCAVCGEEKVVGVK